MGWAAWLRRKAFGNHLAGIRRYRYGPVQRLIHSQSGDWRLLSLREIRFWLPAGRWLGKQRDAPTMTVYSPDGKNTGVAIVVLLGGGYQTLALDLEGTQACDWLTSQGVTCVLLKYRVTDVGPYPTSGHIQNRR